LLMLFSIKMTSSTMTGGTVLSSTVTNFAHVYFTKKIFENKHQALN